MDLFLTEYPSIERAIRVSCERARLYGADAEEFASWVNVKLIENDYAVLRRYERRSTFASYISVVVQRLLLDYRILQWGKWHASAEARRGGELGVTIEALVRRDGRSIDEIMPLLERRWPDVTRPKVEEVIASLPVRLPRARIVAIEDLPPDLTAFARHHSIERDLAARHLGAIVRDALGHLAARDRLIVRMHFGRGMTVACISRVLQIAQKPLYRRLERALTLVRKHLEAAGVGVADVRDVMAAAGAELDFGFDNAGSTDRTDLPEEQV